MAISKRAAPSRRPFVCNVLGMYTGHFFNNKKEGQGRLEDALGGVYEGQWARDVREGRGRLDARAGEGGTLPAAKAEAGLEGGASSWLACRISTARISSLRHSSSGLLPCVSRAEASAPAATSAAVSVP